MRHSMRALLAMLLMGAHCCAAAGEETGSSWWPFNSKKVEATQQSPFAEGATTPLPESAAVAPEVSAAPSGASTTVQSPLLPGVATGEPDEKSWMINSPFGKVSWPRIDLPEFPKPTPPNSPWPEKSQAEAPRNTWMEQDDITPVKPSPLEAFNQRTRAAWNKTVETLTPGEKGKSESSSRVARRDRPPVWKRMFGAGDPRKVEGPQTVTEWMAQERLDP